MTTHATVPTPLPAPPDDPSPRRRIWFVAGVVAWALLLAALAYVSVRHDAPTVREQRSVADAEPVVSRAVGQLVTAAGTDVVPQLASAVLAKGCRITPARSGAILNRDVTFYTSDAGGPALLDRIAQRLPKSYDARARHSADGSVHSLRADAGEFVGVRGTLTGPGVVTLTVTTGCRPVPANFVAGAETSVGLPIDDEPGRVLAALGAAPVAPSNRVSAACPGRGAIYTASAVGTGAPRKPLGDALVPVAGVGAAVVADRPGLYAYRTSGGIGVIVKVDAGEIRVATTTGCQ